MTDSELRTIATAVHVLSRSLHRRGVAQVGLDVLPPSESEVLQQIGARPGSSVSEVARALRLQTSNVSTSVRGLVARGLVDRTTDPDDQRRTLLWHSPDAVRHREMLEKAWAAILADLLSGDDEALLRAAAPAIERLARAVTADPARTL
ncbi:MarR family winged helix-turn-helix transcriptional regulator [Pseudonocardia abyssalis]|uniref:Winged helix-turn-helix transcriptional regulator n=1 Tax=Pseudonocardia abyssalis TaxID=2792008 RepID=A0ABS6UZR8_9PSEU|nr:MarR family transcriptional regulator [Pseudonocardia abyssalis]MBW0114056.1 winged helix-turn-helix transcriptional regulator [Pseudonocardia abyssalis]MBW0137657.1 winged helix-turn-helix transcriptional regulator [Pseudonocardia abyssalis]